MNSLYAWHNYEIMLAESMKEIQREAETDRLIHEAGLSKPGLYERVATLFGSTLVKLGQRLQKKYVHSHQVSHTISGK